MFFFQKDVLLIKIYLSPCDEILFIMEEIEAFILPKNEGNVKANFCQR